MTQEEFFKRYKYDVVDDRIGGGGFGTVYKAYDTTLHREVAIKVSEVKTVNGKTFSLRDEVEALTHVPEHPNIANYEKEKLFTFKMPNGVFDYAVMQYYPDGNLNNAIKQGLTVAQKEDIATQLLEGIAFLHQHKVVHRDLKPGNILIVRDGDRIIPLITDFGLSKAANMSDGSVFSNSFGGGTQRYSSPEQLQGKPLRLNTDLWSYGAILYELFTGEQLFSASSGAANTAQADLEIYNKIVNGNVQSLGVMPEKWRKVAERCLVVDADKRAKDEAELFRIVSGEAQEDETVVNTGAIPNDIPSSSDRHSGIPPFKGVPEGRGIESPLSPKPKDKPSLSDDEGTQVANNPQLVSDSSTHDRHRGLDPRSSTPVDKPKSKKGLWIALAGVAVATIAVVLLLRQPKQEPLPTNPVQEANDEQTSLIGTANGHEWIDLGLPSGTLWATCNVGATSPEDNGNYYAWGETTTKSTYNWETYKYAYVEGDYVKLTKYCTQIINSVEGFTDCLTILQSSDDPATANWGTGWCLPTQAQWQELLDYTTNQWITQNGINGRLFTAKNGQTLFLSAAGDVWDTSLISFGQNGCYWSKSLSDDFNVICLQFWSDANGCNLLNCNLRRAGCSVRPVRER